MNQPRCIWDGKATLAEGPCWMADENALYWVDIQQHRLHRLSLADQSHRTWHIAEQVTSIAKDYRGNYVVTIRSGFAYLVLEADHGAIKPIVLPESHRPALRFNDGKVDAAGRYWAGTMDDGEREATGKLYCLDADGGLRIMDEPYCISNGPTFSPDGKTLYHTSTTERTIYQFDVAGDGRLSHKRVFYRVPEGEGYPDGMTCDAEGCIWLCHFFGWQLSRLSPGGKKLSAITLPVSNVTSCAFGGDDLDTLYITTARWALTEQQLAEQPLAGGVFAVCPGVKGMPTHRFGKANL
ncbi:SMP-30/gluconolactonase/LRE family protein [Simiduia agarivorans]|uniref:Senescence marker protein-30 family protein n=1 Tax=Simiduia agarivorans (strain DSM 21679 / JCM 13881 / BCRC 17597 / SA1) TaxID=1117647 RepID=K4KMP3_SIMAS|nr:SMP-30/gluconolactonase/LRE family protein [Simiduia agarivorans]AFU99495.1 senescence marker protein-30 family protein [Simiduia agarivorans SA1 = DSM 21679]